MASDLSARVLEDLGRRIVDGSLPTGDVLRIDELVEQFAVSRSVVRDALKVLEAQGLVRPRRHVGIEVLGAEHWDALSENVVRWRLDSPQRLTALHQISHIRTAIEPLAASLAATHATSEQRRVIDEAALGMQHTGAIPDLEAYLAHDVVFHRTLLQASGNPMLASLAYLVERTLDARTHHHLMPATPNAEAIRLHRRVAEAIAVGDAATAKLRMQAIVAEAVDAVDEMVADQHTHAPEPLTQEEK